MPDLHHLLLFIAAGVVLNLTPGPDVMFIVANAVRGGLRAGVAAALGISAGCLVHVTAAALGVSALLAASQAAFAVLKWIGALYLVWVGLQMLRGALKKPAQAAGVARASPMNAMNKEAAHAGRVRAGGPLDSGSMRSDAPTPHGVAAPVWPVLRRGFLTNALNPKVALFFLAFVPQFIAPGTPHPGWAFAALGLLFTFNSLLVCCGWALVAAWAARRAGALQRGLRWLDGAAGGLFIAFGIKLALTDPPVAR